MNFAMIFRILGWMLMFEAAFMAPSGVVATIYREGDVIWLLASMGICLGAGAVMVLVSRPKNRRIYAREGSVICALVWFLYSIFGALPFYLPGYVPDFIDAVFETASGFTTTGASILSDVEALPHWLLFWRSFTHWVGGMGILVFVMAVIPLAAGGSTMYLMKAESPGPSVKKMVPKAGQTAGILYKMYFALTALEAVILLALQMPLFDTLCLTFGTAGTGGFAVLNSGLATYSIPQQVVITIFMILFGTNFSVYYLIVTGHIKDVPKVSEAMTYFSIIGAAIAMITVSIHHLYPNVGLALKDAAFQVGSIITTTGYSTTDFDVWPAFSKWILVLLMFPGGCAGSTAGGLKMSRIIILFKSYLYELKQLILPTRVKRIWFEGKAVSDQTVRSVLVFFEVYMMIIALSVLLLTLDGHDMVTNFTAAVACISNIGPGLSAVGPTANYSFYSVLSKLVLSLDMLLGRLEIFPVLFLFAPSVWKKR